MVKGTGLSRTCFDLLFCLWLKRYWPFLNLFCSPFLSMVKGTGLSWTRFALLLLPPLPLVSNVIASDVGLNSTFFSFRKLWLINERWCLAVTGKHHQSGSLFETLSMPTLFGLSFQVSDHWKNVPKRGLTQTMDLCIYRSTLKPLFVRAGLA